MCMVGLMNLRGPQCKCLHVSLIPFLWWLYSLRTGTDIFKFIFRRRELFPGTEYLFLLFVSVMTTKLVRWTHATPQAGSCISQWALNTPLREMWPEAAQGSELIWLQNRGPMNSIWCHSVFNDRAPQNNTCADNTQARSQATLCVLHFREKAPQDRVGNFTKISWAFH